MFSLKTQLQRKYVSTQHNIKHFDQQILTLKIGL